MSPLQAARRRDELGAFLILWMLMLTALLVMVAIVIDLGGVRSSRREGQRTSDLAAIAAGHHMAAGDRIGACRAAVNYVRTNTSLTSLTETCDPTFLAPCDPTGPPVPMTTTSGRYVFHVENPIPDSEIADPAYPSGVLPEDGQPCERMRVRVEEVNDALFAGVIGVNNLTARASAVVRGFIGTNPTQNAGLVVLERRGCKAIEASGNLASVLVKGSIASDGTPRPGIIQVDTKALPGSSPLCSTAGGNIPAKYAVYGTQLTPSHPDRPNQPSIEAEAIGGVPGRIDMFALAFNPTTIHAAYDVPGNGVRPGPTPGVIASRNVVDKVYNPPLPGPTPGRVSSLKTTSSSLIASLSNAVATAPCAPGCNAVQGNDGLIYTVYPPGTPGGPDANGVPPLVTTGIAACASNDATPIEVPSIYPRLFVNCDVLDVRIIRFAGARIVLKGRLQIGSNRVAAFPNATEVIVGGCGGCSPPSTSGINNSGVLLINSGAATDPLVPTCSDGIDNDGDGRTDYNADPALGDTGCLGAADWDERSCLQDRAAPATGPSRLVVNTGAITTSSSSVVQLCQTFVLLADGSSLPHQDVAAATDPTCAGTVDISGAFVPQPCPIDNSYKGFLSLFGTIDWVAPNQNTGQRDTSLPNQYFEDLALWTETSATSEIKGAGNSITGGVYFFPNATFNFSGQASQLIDLNAQFLARRLLLSGQGTLSMQPNPEDTVDTPAPFFKLIR